MSRSLLLRVLASDRPHIIREGGVWHIANSQNPSSPIGSPLYMTARHHVGKLNRAETGALESTGE